MLVDYLTHKAQIFYELTGVFLAFGVVVIVCSILIARFEKSSFGDALYFCVITAFTVGFGDITPKSRGGRILTVLLAFMGLLLIGLVVSVAGEALDRTLSGE